MRNRRRAALVLASALVLAITYQSAGVAQPVDAGPGPGATDTSGLAAPQSSSAPSDAAAAGSGPTDDPAAAARQNYDAFGASGVRRQLTASEKAALREASKPGTAVQLEPRLGVPTSLWAADPGSEVALGASKHGQRPEVAAARGHLGRLAGLYRLSGRAVSNARAVAVHDIERGGIVVQFRQFVGGLEVWRERLSVLLDRDLTLVGVTGYLAPIGDAVPSYALDARAAVAAALFDLGGRPASDLTPTGTRAGFETFGDGARAKQVMYRMPDGLRSAYYVEVSAVDGDEQLDYGYVIDAPNGAVLSRVNLTAGDTDQDPYSYRVWADTQDDHIPFDGPQGTSASPHPTGVPDGFQPPFVAPNLLTLSSGPIETDDPWLPPGATKTIGNNAEAYADLVTGDGFTPNSADIHASVTAPNTFDRTYDTAQPPTVSTEQTQAAATQLFYDVNFMHDWYYDAGFDEDAGNAQADNYGRGGVAGDSMRTEAQDFSGRNNANMFTPADGFRPRMQMFVFDGVGAASLTVHSPANVAGRYPAGGAAFGPRNFEVTGDLVVVNDGIGTTSDGCQSSYVTPVAGKVAVIDRGSCTFVSKVKNAQTNGAVAALIVNSATRGVFNMGGTDHTITIGSLMVSKENGDALKAASTSSTVNATLKWVADIDRDSAIDNTIVAHEWGHYLSHRLTSSLGSRLSGGLGEGWSDFNALLLTVAPEDAASSFNGVYAMGAYSLGGPPGTGNNSFYFGIRRVPYSTDFTRNALTFKHIVDGTPLPPVPTAFGQDGSSNSQVHNTGEVWATMLWECYASLLRAKRLTFDGARDRMRDYLVASLKLTPADPTLLEARDALLMAAYANDRRDFVLFSEAFARRGAGTGAVSADRYSPSNGPVVESYVTGGSLDFAGASLADDLKSCDKRDGLLDKGETGRLYVTLRNNGAKLLTGTTATVSSTNPNVKILDTKIRFAATDPFNTSTAFARVTLTGGTGKQLMDFEVLFNDPDLHPAGPYEAHYLTEGGGDVVLNASASDDVESPVSAWTAAADVGPFLWERQPDSTLNYFWHGPDGGSVSDTSLVSPPLAVGSGEFSISFRHRFAFEQDPGINWDGGVIELSTDGGATWTDIGTGYGGTITDMSGNPLANREAYVGTSASYPDFQVKTINLGTAYANQTVRIRFRIGADASVGNAGWDFDDFVVTGLTNTPFSVLVADPGCR